MSGSGRGSKLAFESNGQSGVAPNRIENGTRRARFRTKSNAVQTTQRQSARRLLACFTGLMDLLLRRLAVVCRRVFILEPNETFVTERIGSADLLRAFYARKLCHRDEIAKSILLLLLPSPLSLSLLLERMRKFGLFIESRHWFGLRTYLLLRNATNRAISAEQSDASASYSWLLLRDLRHWRRSFRRIESDR